MVRTRTVKKKIRHPRTKKLLDRIYIRGKGYFGWNTAYHVYNSDENYDQLKKKDIKKIDYSKSE